jgi:small subunit ribosomal protein S3
MGQKTNPIGNRLGYIQGWESNWYGGLTTKIKSLKMTKFEDTLKLVYLKQVLPR